MEIPVIGIIISNFPFFNGFITSSLLISTPAMNSKSSKEEKARRWALVEIFPRPTIPILILFIFHLILRPSKMF